MRAYKQYSPTNQLWLPDVPSHWNNKKIKHLFSERSDKGHPEEPLLVSSQNMGVVPKNVYGNRTVEAQKDLHLLKLVRTGDFVISLRAFQGGIEYAYYQGIISPAYTIMINKGEIISPYFKYLAKSARFIDLLRLCVTGIREGQNIDYQRLKNYKIPVPPRDEQEQIVRFLDWKVSAINRLIAGRKKQLTLIQELVNKQFMQIAAGAFQQAKIKYCVSLCNDFIEIDKERQYLKTGMYNRGRGIFRRPPLLGADMGDSSFQKIFSGCVMISGQFAWEAATYITTSEDEIGVASHRYYLLKPREEIPAEYIWCFLMSDYGQMQMKLCSHGAAGRNRPLNIKELLDVYMPIPVLGKELNNLIRNVHTLMEMRNNIGCQEKSLAEFRARLISDVVTGKIDVRGVEVPEFAPVEEEAGTDIVEEEVSE